MTELWHLRCSVYYSIHKLKNRLGIWALIKFSQPIVTHVYPKKPILVDYSAKPSGDQRDLIIQQSAF